MREWLQKHLHFVTHTASVQTIVVYICVYAYICEGINEADGYEGMATLGIVVLQVFRLYAHFGNNHDVVFPRENRRWSSNHHSWRPDRHIRVSAALCALSYDLLLRHLHLLFERYD